MKIRMKQSVRFRHDGPLHQPGEVVDVKKELAEDLVVRGAAERYVAAPPEPEPEQEDDGGAA